MRRLWVVVVVSAWVSGCSGSPGADAGLEVASATQLSFSCPQHGVGAFDPSRSPFIGVTMPCTVTVGDRDGKPVPNVTLEVRTEAGRLLVDGPTDATGAVHLTHEVNVPLPRDVEPVVFSWSPVEDETHVLTYAAPLWMKPWEWLEDPRQQVVNFGSLITPSLREPRRPDPIRADATGAHLINNPRDTLVTMIVVLDGEEGFQDTNANGRYDEGEVFFDLPEPFVDEDDDGTRGDSETFIDANGNGQWDGKNGQWDAHTRIWVSERVLWTGLPAPEDFRIAVPGVPDLRPTFGVPPGSDHLEFKCPAISPECQPYASIGGLPQYFAPVMLLDPWFNPIARAGQGDDCVALDAETLPVRVEVNLGFQLTWEPKVMPFTLVDKRIGSDAGLPRRGPPQRFNVTMRCTSTAARAGLDGGVTWLDFHAFAGTCE